MVMIGIESNQNTIYEGEGWWGHALLPPPTLTPAKLSLYTDGPIKTESQAIPSIGGCLFREDSFDPVSRIRRGRFYIAEGSQPAEWHVHVHPALPGEYKGDAIIKKHLETYFGHPVRNMFPQDGPGRPLVSLGFQDRFTIWSIINVEAISTREDLVTLKARSGLGILPDIWQAKIGKKYSSLVNRSLESFADEVYRSSPISVIDRARDAASQILLAYFKLAAKDAKDLGELIKRLEAKNENKIVAASAAKIIARLHARAKPVEKAKRPLREIREQDAELAIQCIGTLLCEIGWADWP